MKNKTFDPTVYWIWLVFGFVFIGGLGTGLLIDGYQTRMCSRLLSHGEISNAHLVKSKKNRRGGYTWELEFPTRTTGQIVHGKRTALKYSTDGSPLSNNITVVYSPENISCWDLSLEPNINKLPMSARNLSQLLTLFFGWTLATLGSVITIICIFRLARPRR